MKLLSFWFNTWICQLFWRQSSHLTGGSRRHRFGRVASRFRRGVRGTACVERAPETAKAARVTSACPAAPAICDGLLPTAMCA